MFPKTHKESKKTSIKQGGFSIIELLVAVSIMVVIMTVTVMGDRSAQQPLKVINNAYDVALFIKEAQMKGTSVSSVNITGNKAYWGVGVHTVQDSSTLTMFRDSNNDGRWNSSDEELDILVLEKDVEVTSSDASILFKRPFVNACIDGTMDTKGTPVYTDDVCDGSVNTTIVITSGSISQDIVVNDVGRITVK